MQSKRLNKEGKVVPSITKPYELYPAGYSNNQDVQRWPRSDYGVISGNLCDVGNLTDEEWSVYNKQRARQRELRERGSSVLTSVTTMGKDVVHTQEDLNRFLVQNNRWAVGDFVTFENYQPLTDMVTYHTITHILAIEREIEKVEWPQFSSTPHPFLLLDLSPMTNKQGTHQWEMKARFLDLHFKRHITSTESSKLIKNNAKLSDYIEQAKAALKAGTLKIGF